MIAQGDGGEWHVCPMRPSYHDEESILRVHMCQVRGPDLGTAAAITTETVTAALETHQLLLGGYSPRQGTRAFWARRPGGRAHRARAL